MKVLFVTNRYPTPRTPGDSPCIARQREALERLGYVVELLFIDSRSSRWNYLKAVWQVFWSTQICRRYDLVHAHYGQYCGLTACAQFARPTIVTFRGSDVLNPRERPVSRLVARFASRLIVMSQEMKDVLGYDTADIIPYGIDLDLLQPASRDAARQELGLPKDAPIVLFPYDPSRKVKRFDLVEQSVSILKKEFPEVQVVAIYDKPYESIPVYMNAADVLVMTSNTEGAPVAVREAMACNLPVVSVDVGDVADVIGSTEGCSIANRDPQDIAEQVAKILRSGMRTNGRSVAMTMGIASYARAVADIYDSLSQNKAKPPVRVSQPAIDLTANSQQEELVSQNLE